MCTTSVCYPTLHIGASLATLGAGSTIAGALKITGVALATIVSGPIAWGLFIAGVAAIGLGLWLAMRKIIRDEDFASYANKRIQKNYDAFIRAKDQQAAIDAANRRAAKATSPSPVVQERKTPPVSSRKDPKTIGGVFSVNGVPGRVAIKKE